MPPERLSLPLVHAEAASRSQIKHYCFLFCFCQSPGAVVFDLILKVGCSRPSGILFGRNVPELSSFRSDEDLEPLISLHHRMKNSFLIGALQQEKAYVDELVHLLVPFIAIDSALALLHFRGVPFQVVVKDISTVPLQIDSLPQ